MKSSPPRLHILLANGCRKAIVFARGPSRRTAIFGWDRSSDVFAQYASVEGRVYEKRSDLSPNGEWLLYLQGNWKSGARDYGSWTRLVKLPDFSTEESFGSNGTYDGGGIFVSDDGFWIHDHFEKQSLKQPSSEGIRRLRMPRNEFTPCVGNLAVYSCRMTRDGWVLLANEEQGERAFTKALFEGWTLKRRIQKSLKRGADWEMVELVHATSQQTLLLDDWEWADWDHNRLVWVDGGKLFAADLKAEGISNILLLKDFNVVAT